MKYIPFLQLPFEDFSFSLRLNSSQKFSTNPCSTLKSVFSGIWYLAFVYLPTIVNFPTLRCEASLNNAKFVKSWCSFSLTSFFSKNKNALWCKTFISSLMTSTSRLWKHAKLCPPLKLSSLSNVSGILILKSFSCLLTHALIESSSVNKSPATFTAFPFFFWSK